MPTPSPIKNSKNRILANKIITKKIKVKKQIIPKHRYAKSFASLLLFGNNIDNSYLKLAIGEKIAAREIKIANKPNSSGEYSLVSIGAIAMGIS